MRCVGTAAALRALCIAACGMLSKAALMSLVAIVRGLVCRIEHSGLLLGVALDRASIAEKLSALAADGVFIGTSSWKYPGWRGLLYDDSRYVYRGKFAESRFEKNCLTEYAEVFKTVCLDAAYYQISFRKISFRSDKPSAE